MKTAAWKSIIFEDGNTQKHSFSKAVACETVVFQFEI